MSARIAGTIETARALREAGGGAAELLRATVAAIGRSNDRLGAFVRLNPRAEDEARAADLRLASGDTTPLTGLPIAIKDNLNTAGLETSCGSEILRGFVPTRDATAVARLRRAGAVIVGKTNLDEFAMGSSTETAVHGPARNPWDPTRVAGGSSGGSAVAVASRMVPLALGSDTGGSVRQPSAFCGVVGLKPTYGRVSRSGLVAFGSSLDQVGPIADTVAGAAALLHCIAGADAEDMTSADEPLRNYAAACTEEVEGLCVGLPAEFFDRGLGASIRTAVESAAAELERRGARIREVALPLTSYAVPTYYLIATAEASSNLARFDAVRFGRRAASGEGLRGMYRATRREGFGAEVRRRIMLGTFALSAGYYDAFYGKAQRARTLLRRELLEVFRGGVDLLLTPTTPTVAFRLGEKLEDPLAMYLSDVYTVTANLAGLPALSVPLGLNEEGLPIGGQLIAPDFGETLLFRAGSALERRFLAETPWWPTAIASEARPDRPPDDRDR